MMDPKEAEGIGAIIEASFQEQKKAMIVLATLMEAKAVSVEAAYTLMRDAAFLQAGGTVALLKMAATQSVT